MKLSPSISFSNLSLLLAECRHYLVGQHAQWSQVCTSRSIVLCLAQCKHSKHASPREKSLVPSRCCLLSPLICSEASPQPAVFPAPCIHLPCRLPISHGHRNLLLWERLISSTNLRTAPGEDSAFLAFVARVNSTLESRDGHVLFVCS